MGPDDHDRAGRHVEGMAENIAAESANAEQVAENIVMKSADAKWIAEDTSMKNVSVEMESDHITHDMRPPRQQHARCASIAASMARRRAEPGEG
mmetsp:Transcript_18001/g.58068  ORF Transcript_18001/g.58068 Transcript_18001/m.58068 type:complete len:94 (-) Transcript_18001:48-329(-)